MRSTAERRVPRIPTQPWRQSLASAAPGSVAPVALDLGVATPVRIIGRWPADSANDDDWDGSFSGHLGAYRRD